MANFNAIQIGVLLGEFYKGGTADQISERTGYNIGTVYRYIRAWHKQKRIFIGAWKHSHTSGRPLAIWELRRCDSEADAVKPKPKSSVERSRVYMQRKVERMAKEMYENMRRAA